MSSKFDPVDVVGAGCWDCIVRLFVFASSLWMGSGIGAWALCATDLFDSPWQPIVTFLIGPVFLLSSLVFLTFPLLLIGIFIFLRTEKDFAPRWAGFATVVGLMVLLGHARSIKYHWLSWPMWLTMSAMLCVATWFFVQWQRNRWIQELETLKEENRVRRIEMSETFGTSSSNLYDEDEP